MARYTGPKVKLSRRVGVPIADIPKHTGKELQIPGMHGYRGRRNTEYGVRLTEKQKLRYYYGMQEKQFRRFLDMAKKSKGNTASTLSSTTNARSWWTAGWVTTFCAGTPFARPATGTVRRWCSPTGSGAISRSGGS